MIKPQKDKNGDEIQIGDTVKFNDLEFEIIEFKMRSYGYVVYEPTTGNAYLPSDLELVRPPSDESEKKENKNSFFKR